MSRMHLFRAVEWSSVTSDSMTLLPRDLWSTHGFFCFLSHFLLGIGAGRARGRVVQLTVAFTIQTRRNLMLLAHTMQRERARKHWSVQAQRASRGIQAAGPSRVHVCERCARTRVRVRTWEGSAASIKGASRPAVNWSKGGVGLEHAAGEALLCTCWWLPARPDRAHEQEWCWEGCCGGARTLTSPLDAQLDARDSAL